jgi:hypothetical protein
MAALAAGRAAHAEGVADEIESLRELLRQVRAERDELAAGHYAALAAERERCAALCDTLEEGRFPDGTPAAGVAAECAAAIRGTAP